MTLRTIEQQVRWVNLVLTARLVVNLVLTARIMVNLVSTQG